VAVILAAAATSVPDTFLSLLSARKGDDSGAVSNAFGSNIFDINICLGLPVLIFTLKNGKPVKLLDQGVRELPVILVALSALTLIIFGVKYRLTRAKAVVLFGLYGLFVLYVVLRGYGFSFFGLLSS
jgi:Ca2+/Na+ antiporter